MGARQSMQSLHFFALGGRNMPAAHTHVVHVLYGCAAENFPVGHGTHAARSLLATPVG